MLCSALVVLNLLIFVTMSQSSDAREKNPLCLTPHIYFFLFFTRVISFSAKVSLNPFLLSIQAPLAPQYI